MSSSSFVTLSLEFIGIFYQIINYNSHHTNRWEKLIMSCSWFQLFCHFIWKANNSATSIKYIVLFVSLLLRLVAVRFQLKWEKNIELEIAHSPSPNMRIDSSIVLWSCSLDFKVAWLCCCNFILSQTDSSLQLMNVTHLSRLAYPFGERGGVLV